MQTVTPNGVASITVESPWPVRVDEPLIPDTPADQQAAQAVQEITQETLRRPKPPAPYILFNDPFAAAAKVLGVLSAEQLFEAPLEVQTAVRTLVQYAKRRVS